ATAPRWPADRRRPECSLWERPSEVSPGDQNSGLAGINQASSSVRWECPACQPTCRLQVMYEVSGGETSAPRLRVHCCITGGVAPGNPDCSETRSHTRLACGLPPAHTRAACGYD